MADRVVYSTEQGTLCPDCQQPKAGCTCKTKRPSIAQADGVVRISRQTQGRKGKEVTLIRGVPLDPQSLAQLGQSLRTACGAGGTVKEGVIEIQGNHIERVTGLLNQRSWTIKRVGG